MADSNQGRDRPKLDAKGTTMTEIQVRLRLRIPIFVLNQCRTSSIEVERAPFRSVKIEIDVLEIRGKAIAHFVKRSSLDVAYLLRKMAMERDIPTDDHEAKLSLPMMSAQLA